MLQNQFLNLGAVIMNVLCHSDEKDLDKETLEKQYELVKLRTSNNYTYMQGSHVMQFGSLNIDTEPASDYLGDQLHPSGDQIAIIL